jgi:hypothetical protein
VHGTSDQSEQFVRKADALLGWIARELGSRSSERAVDVPDADLEYVARRIAEMKQQVVTRSLPPREQRYRSLSRMILDQWPFGIPLASEVSAAEDLFAAL